MRLNVRLPNLLKTPLQPLQNNWLKLNRSWPRFQKKLQNFPPKKKPKK